MPVKLTEYIFQIHQCGISKMKLLLLLLFFFAISAATNNHHVRKEEIQNVKTKRYSPKWNSLDSRSLPEWYDKAKIGIFLHWGVYSVPGFESEWFWKKWKNGNKLFTQFMRKNYPFGFSYEEFAPMFKAEFFDPDQWASLFLKAGAKYVVLTSKHHDGYTLFPSKRSFSWNAVEVGPKRDLVQDLAKSVRSKNLKFGVYHSLFEWYNPMYNEDKTNLYTTRDYVNDKLWPELKQIVNDYKPSVIWSDGHWEAFDTYWNSTDFLAWLYNDSPVKDTVVVNDRWGIGIPCHHGDFYNCADRYNPGKLQKHKWENAFNVDSKSWGYRRNMAIDEILTINQLLKEVVSTVSCGGNALINVGPTKEGTIAPVFQERLLALGEWLSTNGEAIYGTSPWHYQNDTKNANVWYTCVKQVYNALNPTSPPRKSDVITAIYAMFLKWPSKNQLVMHDIVPQLHSGIYKVKMLGSKQYLTWEIDSGLASITLPDQATVQSKNAWTLKFTPDN